MNGLQVAWKFSAEIIVEVGWIQVYRQDAHLPSIDDQAVLSMQLSRHKRELDTTTVAIRSLLREWQDKQEIQRQFRNVYR